MSDAAQDLRSLVRQATDRLATGSASPQLDAELLLCHVLGKPRSYLLAWPEAIPTDDQRAMFETLLKRREHGEPIAYLIGEREFWSLPIRVTADVLIPRPETELLVETALELMPRQGAVRIADLGTGSGAIALALARECAHCALVATDKSEGALTTARFNAEQLGIRNVEFRLGHWFGPLAGEIFDLIISNPPYIREGDPHLERGDLRFEPRGALTSGDDGLDDLRMIAGEARRHLRHGGWLIVEHGYDQGAAVRQLLENEGFSAVETRRDLAGNERATLGRHD